MNPIVELAIIFAFCFLVSALLINVLTKKFRGTEEYGMTLVAAFFRTVLYTMVFYVFGNLSE